MVLFASRGLDCGRVIPHISQNRIELVYRNHSENTYTYIWLENRQWSQWFPVIFPYKVEPPRL